MTATTDYLFVYGTLRPACRHPANGLLAKGAERIGCGWLPGRLYEVSGYPGAVLSDNPGNRIIGELYRLIDPAAMLARLDDYEEAAEHFPPPREYRRCRVEVRISDGRPVIAWVYLYNRSTENLRPIPGGDYCKADRADGNPTGF
jgi:gamma-glutamylcyclotransferase (GGCT)/AIG2-like uncharacterized protein YtfP